MNLLQKLFHSLNTMNRGFINKLWALIQYSWAEGRAPILTRFHGIVFSLVFFYNLIDYRTIEPATSVVSSFALHLFYFAAWFYSVWAVNISVNTVRGHIPPDFNFGGTLEQSVRIWNTFSVMCVSLLSFTALFDWRWRGVALMAASSAVCTIPGLRYALQQTRERMKEAPRIQQQAWRIRQVSIPDYMRN